VAILQDMLDIVHWLTRIKVAPLAAEDLGLPEAERKRGRDMALKLTVPVLTRAWQFLLKGLMETREAQHSLAAAEMVLVRLGYAADLPGPADLIERLRTNPAGPQTTAPAPRPRGGGGPQAAMADDPEVTPIAAPRAPAYPMPQSFADVVSLAAQHRDIKLQTALTRDVHLVHFEAGRIEFRPGPAAQQQLAAQLSERLSLWTGTRWIVSVSNNAGASTIDEETFSNAQRREAEALRDPLVQEALKFFPGAEIVAVRDSGETV
jgi:DNA polymerase-3 subunit gamma/tau